MCYIRGAVRGPTCMRQGIRCFCFHVLANTSHDTTFERLYLWVVAGLQVLPGTEGETATQVRAYRNEQGLARWCSYLFIGDRDIDNFDPPCILGGMYKTA